MNPIIPQLAARFGVKLSNRVSWSVEKGLPKGFTNDKAHYDGQTIATVIRLNNGTVCHKDDHSLMHEIAHYAVAKEEQRDLPEFGLGTVAYGLPFGETDWGYDAIPSVVEQKESDIQEKVAQLLCIHWGKLYGISPRMVENPDYVQGWDHYFNLKFNKELEDLKRPGFAPETYEEMVSNCWEALSRFQGLKE